jgi:hypothetical protein
MSEENSKDTTITNDDLDVLRVLLHSIKGISTVSTTANQYIPIDDTREE